MDLDWSVKRTHNLSTTVAAMPALTFDQLIEKASVFDMLTPDVLTQLRAYVLRSLPLYIVFFAVIAFCIVFPDVVLWLPKHVLPESVGCFKNPSGTGYICP